MFAKLQTGLMIYEWLINWLLSLQAALKHADSQGVIEKMEQEMARLKLKHSLEIKVGYQCKRTLIPCKGLFM